VELGKNLEEAEKLLLRALQINPLDPYILDSVGWCYYKKGDLDLAIQYLEKAVNRLPEDEAVIVEHLADAYLKKGNKEKACELYQKALKAVIHKRDKERIEKKFENCPILK
jgi:tetratricopeptide (TPR) repeat protein